MHHSAVPAPALPENKAAQLSAGAARSQLCIGVQRQCSVPQCTDFHKLKHLFSVDTDDVYTKQTIECIARDLCLACKIFFFERSNCSTQTAKHTVLLTGIIFFWVSKVPYVGSEMGRNVPP